jgi:3-isopropylmalate dehydrogenase
LRENTEGVYVGIGGRFKPDTEDEIAIQEEVNTLKASIASSATRSSSPARSGCAASAWRQEQRDAAGPCALAARVQRQSPRVSGLDATHLYIDALAMFLVQTRDSSR